MACPEKHPERNAQIVRLRAIGFAPSEIARRLSLGRNTVLGVLYRHGLTEKNGELSSRAAYTPAFRKRVLEAVGDLGLMQTSERWGVAHSTISAWSRGL